MLNSDWCSDFSSISAWASEAVRAPINWPWDWRFWSVGPAGDGRAAGEGEGERVAAALLSGMTAGLGLADAEGAAPGVSARTPAGTASRPTVPARLSSRTATLRPRPATAATGG